MPATVNAIIADVITELSQIPGVATQVYASPRIQQYVQDSYQLALEEMWWPDLMCWNHVALDGVTGSLVANLVSPLANHNVARFQDIEAVYIGAETRRLLRLPSRTNPLSITGNGAIYLIPSLVVPNRPFTVVALGSIETLAIHSRSFPTIPVNGTDLVYLDRLLITYMAAYMYLEDDATAPGQIAKFRALAEKRLGQSKAAWNNQAIPLDSRGGFGVTNWTEGV